MPSWPRRRARRLPRPFHRLIGAFAAVSLADGIRAVALPLLAVELTRDPFLVASLGVAQSLPFLVLGLPAGVVVDRVDRRRLLVVTNAVEAVLFLFLLCGVLLAAVPLPLLYLAALTLGTNETLRDTTAATALPAVVASEQLEVGNGRLVAVGFVANQLAGPALGAGLFAAAAALPFGLSGGLALIAAVLVQRLPSLNRSAMPEEPRVACRDPRRPATALKDAFRRARREVVDGVGFLVRHSVLRTVALLAVVLTLTDAAWFGVLVLLVTEELGLPHAAYGVVLAVAAVGGALGGLTASRIIDRVGSSVALRGSLLVIAAAQVTIGVSGNAALVTIALAVGNVACAVWLTAAAPCAMR